MQSDLIRLVGPQQSVEIAGIRLVGMNADSARKFLFTLLFIALVLCLRWLAGRLTTLLVRDWKSERIAFWVRQGIQLTTAIILVLGLASIWFDDPVRLTTALGLLTAGLAFALQRVVTAIAGYFVILRGKTFNVGDRIVMGGVRGDVIALRFTQTTIMEMGQPPPVQSDEPAMWVKSRQYTGRIVTVSNARIFEEPVYNYTREFPYMWDELILPVRYTADRRLAEQILLDVAREYAVPSARLSQDALEEMQRRYQMKPADIRPRVYYRLTDNWLELTIRFIADDHGVRELKDAMSRGILDRLDQAGIGVASATFEVVGLPPLRIQAGGLPHSAPAQNSP